MRPSLLKRMMQRQRSVGPIDRGTATNTIQAPHVASRIMRGLGIREMAPAPEMATTVQPVIVIDDLARNADHDRPQYWTANVIEVGGIPAEYPAMAIENIGQGDVVVESIDFEAAGPSVVRLGLVTLPLANLVTGGGAVTWNSRSDGSTGFDSTPTVRLYHGTLPVQPFFALDTRVGGNAARLYNMNWNVPPGKALVYWWWAAGGGNAPLSMSWFERSHRS